MEVLKRMFGCKWKKLIAVLRKLHKGKIHWLYFTNKHYWNEAVNETDMDRVCRMNYSNGRCLQNFGQEMCVEETGLNAKHRWEVSTEVIAPMTMAHMMVDILKWVYSVLFVRQVPCQKNCVCVCYCKTFKICCLNVNNFVPVTALWHLLM